MAKRHLMPLQIIIEGPESNSSPCGGWRNATYLLLYYLRVGHVSCRSTFPKWESANRDMTPCFRAARTARIGLLVFGRCSEALIRCVRYGVKPLFALTSHIGRAEPPFRWFGSRSGGNSVQIKKERCRSITPTPHYD